MKTFGDLSIKSKLIIILLTMTLITFALCSAIFLYNDLNLFRKSLVRNLDILAKTVGANSRAAVYFEDPNTAENILSSLKVDPQILFAVLYDADGHSFVTYRRDETVNIVPPVFPVNQEGQASYNNSLELIRSIELNGKIIGRIYLKAHLKEYEEVLSNYIFLIGGILFVTVLVSVAIAFKLQSIISNPILSLANTTLQISQEPDYSLRVEHQNQDELGMLFNGFNEMVSQIEKRESALSATNRQLMNEMLERQRSEEALRDSEERLKLALEAITDGVWDWDVTTGGVFFSPGCYTMLGYEPGGFEASIESFRSLLHPDDMELAVHATNAHMQGKTPLYEYESRLITKSGYHLWTLVRGKIVARDKEGNPTRIVGTFRDITERKKNEEALKVSREQIRKLYSHAQNLLEDERKRIAREVHDELGQTLTALKIDLTNVNSDLPPDQRPIKDKIKEMSLLVDRTIETVQRITTELRPQILDIFGINEAIEWQATEFQKRTGIYCEMIIENNLTDLNKDCATTIYRIFQETLTNVARHAEATKIQVHLFNEGNQLVLRVEDNGAGITKSQMADPKSFGLIGIQERALHWGGEAVISGEMGKGTIVHVTIPVNNYE